jgi:hypothetical protein
VRIQPRQQIFEVWKSLLATSVRDGKWHWGGIDGSNSISDAEQLLCLLYPATEIEGLGIDRPDDTAIDVVKALAALGDSSHIPWRVVQILQEYVDRYTDAAGQPIFTGGSYLRGANGGRDESDRAAIPEEQQNIDVLDAYSMSVTLCLASLGFLNVYRTSVARLMGVKNEIDKLQLAINQRLTAAMVGLQRSFIVNWFESTDPSGKVILATVNQRNEPEGAVLERLRERLVRIRTRLRDDIGVEVPSDPVLGREPELFECGWSWGITRNAPPVGHVDMAIAKRAGIADTRPYLYFTVVALDGINDLQSQRTRELNLLNSEQRRLAEGLQARWDLTQRYWSTIARFGTHQWPLEDIPWRTSDGAESDYYSLLVSAVLVQDLVNRQATDDDLTRAVMVLEDLARRGRVTQRVMQEDAATSLHVPGLSMRLLGTADVGPQLYWRVADYAPLMLKRSLQAAALSANVTARDRLIHIAGSAMDHLSLRTIRAGSAVGLWDDPSKVFFVKEERDGRNAPSWYLTERVIEGLVAAANMYRTPPLRSPAVAARTLDLITEADHLFNYILLHANVDDRSKRGSALTTIAARLDRARTIIDDNPGTAYVLVADALLQLDGLRVARDDASRSR